MKILLVDDDPLVLKTTADYLEFQLGHQVTSTKSSREAFKQYQKNPFPLVLTDIKMPDMDGIELLKKIKELPDGQWSDVILITGHGNMENAIAALRSGAYDFLRKPIDIIELAGVVNRVAEHQFLLKDNYELNQHFEKRLAEAAKETKRQLENIQKAYAQVVGIGRIGVFSKSMKKVVEKAERLHNNPTVPVLLEGETGTGKEIIARLIHFGQGDVTSPFVSINCSAISPNLFESELFGYDPGSFTGAGKEGRIGKLELAKGGTLFLDEIGDMPLEMQPKLLRVLQEKDFYRVGGLKSIKLDVRVICATNKDIEKMVQEGSFRIDLFYRLNVGRIHIPPLRERTEDILPLSLMFLEDVSRQKKSSFRSINKNAATLLEIYSWPGNVRELQNAIERVLLWYNDTEITPEHLDFLTSAEKGISVHQDFFTGLNTLPLPVNNLNLDEVNETIIRRVYNVFKKNKSKTAAYLGLSRSALFRLREKANLD